MNTNIFVFLVETNIEFSGDEPIEHQGISNQKNKNFANKIMFKFKSRIFIYNFYCFVVSSIVVSCCFIFTMPSKTRYKFM
jgi:hypothetical protein